MTKNARSGCPISLSLEVLGDRWSLLILRDVIFGGKRSFNEFLGSDERIATNILRDRLRHLVDAGLLTTEADPAHRQRVIYHLTEMSIQLIPTIVLLGSWGSEWLPASPEDSAISRELAESGPAGWQSLQLKLRREHLARNREPAEGLS